MTRTRARPRGLRWCVPALLALVLAVPVGVGAEEEDPCAVDFLFEATTSTVTGSIRMAPLPCYESVGIDEEITQKDTIPIWWRVTRPGKDGPLFYEDTTYAEKNHTCLAIQVECIVSVTLGHPLFENKVYEWDTVFSYTLAGGGGYGGGFHQCLSFIVDASCHGSVQEYLLSKLPW